MKNTHHFVDVPYSLGKIVIIAISGEDCYCSYFGGNVCQGDGMEEVVACSWDGQTYLVNLNRDAVRFPFEENVAAFCAGEYMTSHTEET